MKICHKSDSHEMTDINISFLGLALRQNPSWYRYFNKINQHFDHILYLFKENILFIACHVFHPKGDFIDMLSSDCHFHLMSLLS